MKIFACCLLEMSFDALFAPFPANSTLICNAWGGRESFPLTFGGGQFFGFFFLNFCCAGAISERVRTFSSALSAHRLNALCPSSLELVFFLCKTKAFF